MSRSAWTRQLDEMMQTVPVNVVTPIVSTTTRATERFGPLANKLNKTYVHPRARERIMIVKGAVDISEFDVPIPDR